MHSKWTTVLFGTVLAGSVAATTGIAAGTALARHPMIKPPLTAAVTAPAAPAAPDARRTVAAMGALGGVLAQLDDLAAAAAPDQGAGAGAVAGPVDAVALKGRLRQLGAAAEQLRAALPSAPSTPGLPGVPALPGGVQPGGPMQRELPSAPAASVEERLAALQQDAAALVDTASAGQVDGPAVRSALAPLATDSLALSNATTARLAGA
ncbi:hypothetical protein [Kitasatospora sp. NBC_01266]|uniref:hypothetical protein n=1 Tax=Kitasatospora sp. NBC_01266 TaxID=2903572 RepID=UPI002E312C25|nr:hypothetical protein [Kitasatospora sp. NBC_01266]